MNKIKTILATIASAYFSFFGLLAVPLLLLVLANVIDYITGMMAIKYRNQKVSSEIGFQGIFKKVSMYVLIIVGFMIDTLAIYLITNLGIKIPFTGIVACILSIILVCNEINSILENLNDMGDGVPKFLIPLMKFIKNKIESKIKIEESE